MIPLASDDAVPVPTVSNDLKSHIASYFSHLELANAVVVFMMISVSCDAKVTSHDHKDHVTHCLNHLVLANKMVPVMMQSTACDAHGGANSITRPRVM